MASPRENLLNTYANATSGLQNGAKASSLALIENILKNVKDPLEMVYDEVDGQQRSKLYLAVREVYPSLAASLTGSAVELANSFYTMRRQQVNSTIQEIDSPKVSVADAVNVKELDSSLLKHWEVTGMLQKVLLGGGSSLEEVSEAISGSIGAIVRESTDNFFKAESQAVTAMVYTQGSACTFCKTIAAQFYNSSRGGAEITMKEISFHDSCNCVIDYTFKGEKGFKQDFINEINKKNQAAIDLIRSGEGGERLIQRGSQEWFAEREQELKDMAKKTGHRLKRAEVERVNSILEGIIKGDVDSSEEEWLIDRTSFDFSEIDAPINKKITSLTQKNIETVARRL